jgi:ankyrin repeat protein/L-ascorbate metabolism protein UlaG (beta-lactamase superfamily)
VKKLIVLTLAVLALFLLSVFPMTREEMIKAFENGETAKILDFLGQNPERLKMDLGAGMTPLHYAAYYGNDQVADYALKHGTDLNVKDRRGLTPVWFTVSGSRPALLKKLIALGADLRIKNPAGDDMLFRAATAGNPEVLEILLANGFEAQAKNQYGMTPITYAARGNGIEAMKLLASRGSDLKAVGASGFTLLHEAVFSGRAEAINYLLDRGLDVNAKAGEQGTPLLLAVNFGNVEGALALARRGADVNAADASGVTAFLFAVKKGQKAMVEEFLKDKADVRAADPRTGKTALHEAAARGYSAIAGTLIAGGADKNALDKDGRTALSYALKYGNKTVGVALRKAGVKDVPWEVNLDDSAELMKALGDGQATIWYLRHSGWALKTRSAVLIFDYWDDDPAPDEKLLANGHINPEELKARDVYVFVSHEHGDHFDRQILEWRKTIPSIHYIFGFEMDPGDGIVYAAPRTEQKVGNVAVTTIKANDAGVGFAVQVDGLTVFHAGDHSNNTLEAANNDFFPEIDFLAGRGIRPDVAFFLNMYGCGSTNPEAFEKGIFYAVDKLGIKAVLPMHGAYKEWVYGNLAEAVAKNGVKVAVGVAVNQGDRFFYKGGALLK